MATTETLAPVDEWVTAFQHDLDVFRRWAADPRLTGLRTRITGTQLALDIRCDTGRAERVLPFVHESHELVGHDVVAVTFT